MKVLFYLLFFSVPAAISAQSDTLPSTGNKDFDRFLADLQAYEQTNPRQPLLADCSTFRLAWTHRVDDREQSVVQNDGQPLCPEDKRGRSLQPGGLCLSSRYIGDRYYVCSYEKPAGSLHTTTWYYVRDSSVQVQFKNFLAEMEAYKNAPHPPDALGPCEEYRLVWHFSNHSFLENVQRGSGEALCKERKTEHLLTGGCWPQVIGDRYYICIIDIPVSTIRQDIYYYERQPETPVKKPGAR